MSQAIHVHHTPSIELCIGESGTEIKNNVNNKLKRATFQFKSSCSEKLQSQTKLVGTRLFFPFPCFPFPSQCCLSLFSQQILYTNIERAGRQNVSQLIRLLEQEILTTNVGVQSRAQILNKQGKNVMLAHI